MADWGYDDVAADGPEDLGGVECDLGGDNGHCECYDDELYDYTCCLCQKVKGVVTNAKQLS